MALFGKKKKADQAASSPEDEIVVAGGDADETGIAEDDGGQVIDFDAIAGDLNDDDGESEMGEPLGDAPAIDLSKAAESDDDLFNTTPGFEANSAGNAGLDADDELDFDAVFDDGSPAPAAIPVDASDTMSASTVQTDENPFGDGAPSIEPVGYDNAGATEAPPLTHTAPLTMSDIADGGHAPAVKKSLPLLPLLGAAGLLLALGAVAFFTLGQSKPIPEDAPIVSSNPTLNTTATGNSVGETPDMVPLEPATAPAPGVAPGVSPVAVAPNVGAVGGANPGIAPDPTSIDGVPIAPPNPLVVQGTRPVAAPALQSQLKALWNKGAAAKGAKDFAGARAAWLEILRLDPGHDGIQSAIDKLPPA